jgi:hypothetical protein
VCRIDALSEDEGLVEAMADTLARRHASGARRGRMSGI